MTKEELEKLMQIKAQQECPECSTGNNEEQQEDFRKKALENLSNVMEQKQILDDSFKIVQGGFKAPEEKKEEVEDGNA